MHVAISKHPTALAWSIDRMVRWSSYQFFRHLCKGEVTGSEHISTCLPKGFVVAANHSSYLDWLVLGTYFHYEFNVWVRFLAKDRMFHHPIWKYVAQEEAPIRVSDDGQHILEVDDFARSRYLAVFPEGGRSRNGQLQPAHTGAIKLAIKLGVPILPAGLSGFWNAWPPHRRLPRPRKCFIDFGQPINLPYAAGVRVEEEVLLEQTNALMASIRNLLDRRALSALSVTWQDG